MYKRIIVLACIIAMSLSNSIFAGTPQIDKWQGIEGADWNLTTNWNTGVVPQALDPVGGPQASLYSVAEFGTNAVYTSPNLTSGVVVSCDMMRVGNSSPGSVLTVSGGIINVSEYVYLSYTSGYTCTLNMNDGTINCGARIAANGKFYVGRQGSATLNMGNGTINCAAALTIADSAGTSWVHLNGGTITATDLLMNTSGSHLDIAGGTLILDGDDTAAIDGFISAGKITAYGGGAGTSVQKDYNVTHAGKTTVTGFILSPKATNPTPTNNATNTNVTLTLTWTAGLGATSHNVYLGTSNPPASQGSVSTASFDTGALIPNKQYYWQIDEVSGSGTTPGDLWTFTTTTGQPIGPNPVNNSSNIVHPILSWTGGLGATGHNVYFGLSAGTMNLVSSNQSTTTYDPGNLLANTAYFWQIEELYGTTTITGPVWNFVVGPTKAYQDPATTSEFSPKFTVDPVTKEINGWSTNVPVYGITLNWLPGLGAVSHDIYLGTSNPPEQFLGNTGGLYFPVPIVLAKNTVYYWRVDEKDSLGGTSVGDIWHFTTANPPDAVYPYLTWRGDPTTTITVNWWNPASTGGDTTVDYGTTSSYGSSVTDSNVTVFHHITITGLTPSTTYHYRIRSSDGTVGEDNTFVTGTVNPTSFSFIYYGDPRTTEDDGVSEGVPGKYSDRQTAFCNWVAQQDIAFAIEGGDTVWEGQSLRAFGRYWPEWFKYEAGLTKTKVVMHTLGNHEVQGGGTYFRWGDFYTKAVPANGPVSPDTLGRLYSFDYGNAHFVSCASYQVDMPVVQKTWLQQDFAAAKARGAKWIFTFFHYPLYTTSGHLPRQNDVQNMGPVFDEYGVTVAFQSHNHVYERWTPLITYYDTETNPDTPVWTGKTVPNGEGTVYITNGVGGAEFNNCAADPRLVQWFGTLNVNTTIATKVTISGDNYCLVQAIRNDTGEVIDSFQVQPRLRRDDCNKDGITDIKDLGCFSGQWLDSGMWP